MHTVAEIGFLNTTVSVEESSGFSTLFVSVLGNISLGRDVIIQFSTANITAAGDEKLKLLSD